MEEIQRKNDIQGFNGPQFQIIVNGRAVDAAQGETVISALNAVGLYGFSENNHQHHTGGYCWMGICHSCLVKVDGFYNRRACQTIVQPGMRIETNVNRINEMGLK